MTLDIKDRKILYELSKNCRLPTSQIAKRVGLSQQVADYRIQRLIKNKVITGFITEMNLEKLGYGRHIFYIQLRKVDERKEKEILDYLVRHPFLTWVTTATGKWSIILDIIARDLNQVNHIIQEIKQKYDEYISEYQIVSQVAYRYFHSKYYGFKEKEAGGEKRKNIQKIDDKDKAILKRMAGNARIGLVALAKETGLSANRVKQRIKKMMQENVIHSVFIEPDKQQLGYEQYNIQLMLENAPKEQEKKFMHYLDYHPNVNFYYKPIGLWSFEIGIFVKNPGELRKIMIELRNLFPNIKIHDSTLFYEEWKNNVVPQGVFER